MSLLACTLLSAHVYLRSWYFVERNEVMEVSKYSSSNSTFVHGLSDNMLFVRRFGSLRFTHRINNGSGFWNQRLLWNRNWAESKKLLFIEIKQKFSLSAMNFRLINDTVLRVIIQAYHRKVNLIAFHYIWSFFMIYEGSSIVFSTSIWRTTVTVTVDKKNVLKS